MLQFHKKFKREKDLAVRRIRIDDVLTLAGQLWSTVVYNYTVFRNHGSIP